MITKEWLNRGRNIDAEIAELKAERKKAMESATNTTAQLKEISVQESGGNSSERKFASCAVYRELIDKKIDELLQVKAEIFNAINAVEDSTLRQLLIYRYIAFEKWEKVALSMNYSYAHVVQILHPRALKKIEKIIQNNT